MPELCGKATSVFSLIQARSIFGPGFFVPDREVGCPRKNNMKK